MTSKIAPRNTNISYNTHQTAAWNKDSIDVSPDFLQLKEKCFVVLNMPELVRILIVLLEVPIGG